LLAFAQPQIHATDSTFGKYFCDRALSCQDTGRGLTLKDMQSRPGLFHTNKSTVINFGTTLDYNWVKFKLVNDSKHNNLILNLENPIVDEVWFYCVHSNNIIDSIHLFESDPVSSRTYKTQFYLFDINIPRGDSATCYLKLYSPKQILVPLTIGSEAYILHIISNSDLLSGLYYGIMLVMLLYNIFIFFTVRDRSYLWYVQYIFWVAITQATLQGYAHRFLWTDNIWLTNNMVYIAGAMAGIATVIFTKSFLQSKTNLPRLNILLTLIIGGDLIALALMFSGYLCNSYNAINATAGIGSLIVIFCASTLVKNFRPARFYLISYSVFLSGVIVFVLKDYNIVPYNVFTSHSMQLGSAIEAILLSFALADKINIFRTEKEESQAQTLLAVQENERIVREQNVILEVQVSERTRELKVSNDGLNTALIDLKDAQSQLVESEKMASLGQLTAGIAHEINNPINFVTSNVKPLNRDVLMLIDAVDTLESIAKESTTTVEKQKKIEEYKNDIDYDYLKMEIDQLLKGIGDGAARTAEIVKGLRIFSRLDEDDLKKADINEGLDSTLVIINNLMGNSIQLEKKYANLSLIECYPGKLNQVFLNIISNAIYAIKKKFNGQSGGLLTITTLNDDKFIFVKIADNGTGMDENTRKRLFEPFFTTKDVGEGTGLGLSIVYNTINKHNGQIFVNSEVGIGSEFTIKLPLTQK
jgi:two-component system NtrC family sensor kinase